MTDSTQPEYGFRTAKGEWRPPYPVKFAPLFCWPPRPIEALKWFLGYPGYLLPWNSIYLLISVVTWFWLRVLCSLAGGDSALARIPFLLDPPRHSLEAAV